MQSTGRILKREIKWVKTTLKDQFISIAVNQYVNGKLVDGWVSPYSEYRRMLLELQRTNGKTFRAYVQLINSIPPAQKRNVRKMLLDSAMSGIDPLILTRNDMRSFYNAGYGLSSREPIHTGNPRGNPRPHRLTAGMGEYRSKWLPPKLSQVKRDVHRGVGSAIELLYSGSANKAHIAGIQGLYAPRIFKNAIGEMK